MENFNSKDVSLSSLLTTEKSVSQYGTSVSQYGVSGNSNV